MAFSSTVARTWDISAAASVALLTRLNNTVDVRQAQKGLYHANAQEEKINAAAAALPLSRTKGTDLSPMQLK